MTKQISDINLLQWNCCSIVAKKPSLLDFIAEKDIHILLLSETHLSPEQPFNFPGYNIIRKDRAEERGSVAILIAVGIEYEEITLQNNFNESIEVVAVRLLNNNLNLVSLYNGSGGEAAKIDWDNIFNQFDGKFLISGDLTDTILVGDPTEIIEVGKLLLQQLKIRI